MKTLYILRHAKSDWDNAGLSDYERPLNKRGREAAPLMGEMMKTNEFQPPIIISSPAVRARQTAELVRNAAELTGAINFDSRIYEARPQTLLQIASEINDEFDSAIIVGHNPGLEGLIKILTGETKPMPTAALAVIDLDIARWNQIASAAGDLRELIRPKEVG
ncbi:MAG: histidine phosphatase family protein [Acidobacteriota bacterium]|nr:histidine phosphatase family protein [Acidobacteriota bacterium]